MIFAVVGFSFVWNVLPIDFLSVLCYSRFDRVIRVFAVCVFKSMVIVWWRLLFVDFLQNLLCVCVPIPRLRQEGFVCCRRSFSHTGFSVCSGMPGMVVCVRLLNFFQHTISIVRLKIIVMKTMARYSKFMRENTTNMHLIFLAETCCLFLPTSRQEPGGTSPQVPRQSLLLHVMPSWLMSCPHQSIASPRWRESRSFADCTGSCVQSICIPPALAAFTMEACTPLPLAV